MNRVTIKDIAQKVGRSHTIVSAVLSGKDYCFVSDEMRKKILETAREMNYRPSLLARSLKNSRSNTIGFVQTSFQNIPRNEDLFFFNSEAEKLGFKVFSVYTRGDSDLLLKGCQDLLDRGVDALVISGSLISSELYLQIRRMTEKVCFISQNLQLKDLDGVFFLDYSSGLDQLLSALKRSGHQEIHYLITRWNENNKGQRYLWIQNQLEKQGADLERYVHVLEENPVLPSFFMSDFLARNPECTALICSNDRIALKVLQNCHLNHIPVPGRISITGFDNIESCELCFPQVTTIAQPFQEAVQAVFQHLKGIVESGSTAGIHAVFKTKLILRESIGMKYEI